MSSYNNNHYWGKMAAGVGVLLLFGMIYSCSTSDERELSTDIGDNSNNNYYFDEESGEYRDAWTGEALAEDPFQNNLYRVNYINEDTVDDSRYRDVEYEPFTHSLYVKTQGTVAFDQLISVDAPEGYQVDYCIPMENSNGQYGSIYGYITLKFTNTEKVVVREYYDTATGKYVSTNFGTVVEKEKQKTIEQ